MNKLEKSIQKNAFNKDELLLKIQAETYGTKSSTHYEGGSMKKVIGILAISFTLIFAAWFGFNQNKVMNDQEVVMVVGVDINPSFELSVNRLDDVVKIDALNDDAKTIDVSDLIGDSVEDVVEEIILRSEEAGFIDVNDLEEDYIVVSNVSLNDDEALQDRLQDRIKLQIRDSEFLQSLNIVQIKATQREKMEAEGKNIPIGLYIINGYVLQEDGSYLSAKEFFSNPENKEKVTNRLNITLEKQERLRDRLEETLHKLETEGYNATEYRLRLENATYDQMLQIQAELRNQTMNKNGEYNNPDDNPGESNKPDDSNEGSDITEPRGNSNVLPKENQNAGKGN